MTHLPDNFFMEKYGIKVRLVVEDDAEFILSLRANPYRTMHMKTLNYEIENQKEWIREYKKREKEGLDYYFIYSNKEDKLLGVNRISNIDYEHKRGKSSSWIAVEGLKFEPLKMLILGNEIVFNILGIVMSWGEVHKNNSRVIKIFNLFGYNFIESASEYYNFTIHKDDYLKAREKSLLKNIMAH